MFVIQKSKKYSFEAESFYGESRGLVIYDTISLENPSYEFVFTSGDDVITVSLSGEELYEIRMYVNEYITLSDMREFMGKEHKQPKIKSEGGDLLRVYYDNMGEPYREGIAFALDMIEQDDMHMFFEKSDVRRMDFQIGKLYRKIQEKERASKINV